MACQMGHVIASIARSRDNLVCIHPPSLAQRPKRGRTCPGPAKAKHRTTAALKCCSGLFNHLRADAFTPHRDKVIIEAGSTCRSFHRRSRRLIGCLAIRSVIDDRGETRGLVLCHFIRAELARNTYMIIDPLEFQITSPVELAA